MDRTIDAMDAAILRLVLRRIFHDLDLDTVEVSNFEAQDRAHIDGEVFYFDDHFEKIDQKAGVLLTHVSVMIAINTLALDGVDPTTIGGITTGLIVIAFLTLYLLSALGTLRCLRFWSFRNSPAFARFTDAARSGARSGDETLRFAKLELVYKIGLYRTSLQAMSITTALSIPFLMLILFTSGGS